ncbi:MAG: sulfurtransferase TusA family protein [Rhodospirillales bacterium]|nr:sulfurtransferase TusA family protein [Rhodospirillales bacterium]
MTRGVDLFLDITQEVCPLTFVKTKLLLERMAPGQTAAVRLGGAEPLENVPRSVREHGHTVLSLQAEESAAPDAVHILVIRKEEV